MYAKQFEAIEGASYRGRISNTVITIARIYEAAHVDGRTDRYAIVTGSDGKTFVTSVNTLERCYFDRIEEA